MGGRPGRPWPPAPPAGGSPVGASPVGGVLAPLPWGVGVVGCFVNNWLKIWHFALLTAKLVVVSSCEKADPIPDRPADSSDNFGELLIFAW